MEVLQSKSLCLAEVADYLNERKKEASGTLEYEQANTLAYAEAFGHLSKSKIDSFVKEVSQIAALPETQAVQVADLMPRNEDELAQLLAASKVELPKEQLKEIIKVVKKYGKK